MKTTSIITGICISLLLASCGGSDEDSDQIDIKKNPLGALMKMGKEMEKQANETADIMAERRKNGDTLAMPYQELQHFLPESIEGFTRGEPNGATMNMSGMSYSSAECNYTGADGAYVRVSLVDYNAAFNLYTAATSIWAAGLSIDTPEEKTNGFKVNDEISGWETLKKKSKDVSVVVGAGKRFLITVEANNQEGTDFAKDIAVDIAKGGLSSI
ncbi:MAG: hypothetical protein ACE5DN_00170 [Flavobacteriales bacterium]